jgi:flagellar basal-body rod protein FlgB
MESKLANFLFEATGVQRYRRFLDIASMRHKLISGNVANVSTPGYKSQDIDFKAELAKSAKKSGNLAGSVTHAGHIPLGSHPERTPEIHKARVRGSDMNSVDIDKEVPKMAQNELEFTIGARLLKKKFEGLRKAINGQ